MRRTTRWMSLALVLLVPPLATAQPRGRTDGPEGSEIGKGGYRSADGGMFSLALSWGAGLPADRGAPLFVGFTGTLWLDEWFVLDVAPSYLASSGRVNLLLGPRFRTATWPVSGTLGLHAGPIITPDVGLRFGLSPNIGVDAVVDGHYLLGLQYALDLPIGGGAGPNHRLFMNLGYRF
jgi:hypothetical protein